jgi:hypothetical protein
MSAGQESCVVYDGSRVYLLEARIVVAEVASRQAPNRAALEATCFFFFDRQFRSFCAGLALCNPRSERKKKQTNKQTWFTNK